MTTTKVTITVPSRLLSATKKRGTSFSGYVSSLIAADIARRDMRTYLNELASRAEVTEDDRRWAREQLVSVSRKQLRRAG